MKLLLSLFATLFCSMLGLSAEEPKKQGERIKVEINIAQPEYVTISRAGEKVSKETQLKDLLDINKLIPNKHGLQANLYFPKTSDQNSTDFKLLFMFLKSSLEKQNCLLYEAKISSCGLTGIYVYGPNKAAYEARQTMLAERYKNRLDSPRKVHAEFTKDITFMKLMEKKCRENKWKSFNWKIDEERSISMLVDSDEKPDIEPMLISVMGVNDFRVNKVEPHNLGQLIGRLNEYKTMAASAGSMPIFAIHTGKLSSEEVYPILIKLHRAGLRSLSVSKPMLKAPVVTPPVNRRPASPHR